MDRTIEGEGGDFRCAEYVTVEPDRKVRCTGMRGHGHIGDKCEELFHQGLVRVLRPDGTEYAMSTVWSDKNSRFHDDNLRRAD